MAYTPTTWNKGVAPGISAALLNHLETQFEEVQKLFNAHTILIAVSDDLPIALSIPASRIIGRGAAGDIVALTGTEVRALIGWTANKLLKGAGAGVAPTEIAHPLGKDELRWTDEKLLKGKGAGVVPEEIAVPISATESWLHIELVEDAIVAAVKATVADFQANAATGTFSANPQNINDNNTGTTSSANTIGQYAEVDFGKPVIIKRWRQFGHVSNNGSGMWKIQYWDFISDAWADWVTDIATRTTADWSSYVTETAKLTTKIRLIATTIDTALLNSYLGELEVIY